MLKIHLRFCQIFKAYYLHMLYQSLDLCMHEDDSQNSHTLLVFLSGLANWPLNS